MRLSPIVCSPFLLAAPLILAGCSQKQLANSPEQIGEIQVPASSERLPAKGQIEPPVIPRTDLLNYSKSIQQIVGSHRLHKNLVSLQVEKSNYRLIVYYQHKPIKSYPVVLGANPVDNKLQYGDNCTPEGSFTIRRLYPHHSWSRFLWLDYPTRASWKRFNEAKKKGLLRPDAKIGGEIGIHGVPLNTDRVIDQRVNWTLGCIALKRKDIEELYTICQPGTSVTILH